MTTDITMAQAQQTMSLADRIAILRRSKSLIAWTFSSLAIVTLLVALLWPPTYTSTGTILIEQQEVPPDLVRSTISSYADQRLQMIEQRVMTSENLWGLIKRYDLYAEMRQRRAREEVIERMRKDTKFDLISADVIDPRSGQPTKATIAFSISYSNRSPDMAAKVANELVTLYLQENVENRQKRAADATDFLNDEAQRLDKQIDALQKKLAAFKERHLNDLPDLASINMQLMNRTEDDIHDVDAQIRSLDQQVIYLDAQLAQISPTAQIYTSTGERVMSPEDRLKTLRSDYARVSAIYSPTHPDVVRLKREIAGLEKNVGTRDRLNDIDRQLEDATTKLTADKERYAADYPDVIQLEKLVKSLTEQRDKLRSASATQSAATSQPDNPAYIQLMAQREASAGQRSSLEQKRAELKARLEDFAKRLQSTPGVERDYTDLTRELDNQQIKYREVKQKQMEAKVAQNLEDQRKSERFTLIEPPLVPEVPTSPNRIAILILGVLGAFGAAIGAAILRDTFDDSVRNKRDLHTLLDVPPLAVVPWVETKAERRMRIVRRRFAWSGAAGTFVLALVAVHVFYRPLDVLWEVLLRRLG